MVLYRGDHKINENKLQKIISTKKYNIMNHQEIKKHIKDTNEFINPFNTLKTIKIFADYSVANIKNAIIKTRKKNYYLKNINYKTDFQAKLYDLKTASKGDKCIKCSNLLIFNKSIEIGHIFYLGTKYSSQMNAFFLNNKGKKTLIEMGCYGIGISRIIATIIEQNYDKNGIVWPLNIAPFTVSIISLSKNPIIIKAADKLYKDLKCSNFNILYDDRNIQTGQKLKDNDLLGIPFQINIGKNLIKTNQIDIRERKHNKKHITIFNSKIIIKKIKNLINNYKK